ncbi:MAG: carbonic anhydrase [Bacteroidales bacterium]|nr:carbonic anhydrase [Bacteroidales bacterium]
MDWKKALERLEQGNKNFIEDKLDGKLQNSSRRQELVSGQQPYAIILSCADSRVVPEFAFDTGLGELFVVRVAGNVANISTLASIEYAVANLNTNLIVVLGHESCGAVTAAIQNYDKAPNENFHRLFELIKPAIRLANKEDVNQVVKKNAELTAKALYEKSDIVRKAVDEEKLKIVPAYYHLKSGKIDFEV